MEANAIHPAVTGQNGIVQNGTDKMVWTKWYGQNGTDKMVAIFIDSNLTEFLFSNHKSQISDKPKWV